MILLATDLCHDRHQCNGTDVSAFTTHVAACNYLESCLLGSVDIIGYKSSLHYSLFDGVSPGLNGKCFCELWSSYRR
jgi:hypothetical protein